MNRIGLHDFHAILRDPAVTSPAHALLQTYDAFHAIFTDAQDLLRPPGWRLLRLGPPARWSLLCDATIDARAELIEIADRAAQQCFPPAWLDGHDAYKVAEGVRMDLSDSDPDASKAAFLVVGAIQHVQLDPASRLPWWESRTWLGLLTPR